MAEDKKSGQKPAQKKTASSKGSSKKSASQKTTVSQASSTSRTRKASRPPTIDLKAEAVSPASENEASESAAEKEYPSKSQSVNEGEKIAPAEKEAVHKDTPPLTKPSKGSGLAAGGIGLVAGAIGGLVAGFIYTNTQTDALPSPAVLALQDRVENIEKTSNTSQPDGALVTRLEKAESDTRFLNTQLDTLGKDIAKLKEQLTLFSGKFIPSGDGVAAAPSGVLTTPPVDLSNIESKLAQLEQQMNDRAKSAGALTEKLGALQKEIANERAVLSETSQKQAQSYQELTKSVDAKIAKIYRAGGDNRIRAAALSLSLGQLVEVAKTAQPFAGQLKAVRALLKKDKIIDQLQPLAEKGVPDIALLQAEFAKIAFEESQPSPKPIAEATLVDKLISSASSVVKVSKLGEKSVQVSPLDALKQQLKAGDLDAVLRTAAALDDEKKQKLQPWLANVQNRVKLDAGISTLQTQILAEIGKASGRGEEKTRRAPPASQNGPQESLQAPTEEAPAALEAPNSGTSSSAERDAQ